jgi:uncharacterized protein
MTNKQAYYKWQGNNLLLELYVQPRANKNKIVGLHGDYLKIAISTPPVEGKANKQLIKFLAKHFSVPQNQVKIIKGENSRYKSVLIEELNPDQCIPYTTD